MLGKLEPILDYSSCLEAALLTIDQSFRYLLYLTGVTVNRKSPGLAEWDWPMLGYGIPDLGRLGE